MPDWQRGVSWRLAQCCLQACVRQVAGCCPRERSRLTAWLHDRPPQLDQLMACCAGCAGWLLVCAVAARGSHLSGRAESCPAMEPRMATCPAAAPLSELGSVMSCAEGPEHPLCINALQADPQLQTQHTTKAGMVQETRLLQNGCPSWAKMTGQACKNILQ